MFFYKYYEIFQNSFIYGAPPVAASEQCSYLWRSSNRVKKLTFRITQIVHTFIKENKVLWVSSQTFYAPHIGSEACNC